MKPLRIRTRQIALSGSAIGFNRPVNPTTSSTPQNLVLAAETLIADWN
ncbi:MAG: hypothetical protein ACRCXD_08640 [Luteolibacter sp.]